MKRVLFFFVAILFFALPLQAQDTAKVLRVIDGDTLKVNYRGQKESVRLIGIDTPESRINDKAKRDALRSKKPIAVIIAQGEMATTFTLSIVRPGDTVRIEFDVQKRDKYGRLLCYAYFKDKMLNEEIVKAGHANIMTIPPNIS
jgi:micrococcal nuclease